MTNPVFFEDPRTLTEVRPIFIHHNISTHPPLAGGDLQVVAMQVRAALTERLSVVAAKDGFIFTGSDAPLDDGWADIALGLKYNLYSDPALQQLWSVGLSYELPVGTPRALQGNGDGEFYLYTGAGAQVGDWWHLISTAGFRLPADTVDENQLFSWGLHLDRQFGDSGFYFFNETNWYHYLKSGAAGIPTVGGMDFFNLGSSDVAGNDVVTDGFGIKYKPSIHCEIGVAWEVPLTDRRDLIDNRLTTDLILRY
ncbi:MAG: hypothetical protein HY000_35310 [Planctomycetes bacterium]|nr:hypothetical protein [Planctomycetota bacterium]